MSKIKSLISGIEQQVPFVPGTLYLKGIKSTRALIPWAKKNKVYSQSLGAKTDRESH